MEINDNRQIVCFGETLWDVFPNSKKPGGAPLNVAVHLTQFGLDPLVISRIGQDDLGSQLADFIDSKRIKTNWLQVDPDYPTGIVNVEIAESGDASYDIVFPSAWDFIEFPKDFVENDYILIFGSLASRNKASKETLLRLLDRAQLALFDVNFRSPHYSRELIEELLQKSHVIKLNEDEIEIFGSWYGIDQGAIEKTCEVLTEQYQLDQIIVTLGSKGAMVYKDGNLFRHPGYKVKVADTVGSGDSFLAAYLAHFLKEFPIEECLDLACATGAYVASQNGAVPEYREANILNITNQKSRT